MFNYERYILCFYLILQPLKGKVSVEEWENKMKHNMLQACGVECHVRIHIHSAIVHGSHESKVA